MSERARESEREENGWVRVERGKKQSECHPVRQIWSRRGASRIGEAHRLGRTEVFGKVKVVRREEGQIVRSFLVRNFPPDCSPGELIAKCSEVGPVVDLYCPMKRDVTGKRFCFVRLALFKEAEEEVALELLNNLWIDSYKLRAFRPLFGRREDGRFRAKREEIPKDLAKAKKVGETPRVSSSAMVNEGISFLQKAKGWQHPEAKMKPQLWKTCFSPKKGETRWLEHAWVGKLKQGFSWDENREDILLECRGKKLEAKFLGDDLILILSVEEGNGDPNMIGEWGNYWCNWFRPWKPSDVSQRREIWTWWYGVPLHAWSEDFFKQISLHFGEFLEWDRKFQNQCSFDKARVKIQGFAHSIVNETVLIEIDKEEFPVTIVEEVERGMEQVDLDEDDFSEFSQEFDRGNLWVDNTFAPASVRGDEQSRVREKRELDGPKVIIANKGARIETDEEDLRGDDCCSVGESKTAGRADLCLGGAQGINVTSEGRVGSQGEKEQATSLGSPVGRPNSDLEGWAEPPGADKLELEICEKAQPEGSGENVSVGDSVPFPPGWGPIPMFPRPSAIGLLSSEDNFESAHVPVAQVDQTESQVSEPIIPSPGEVAETPSEVGMEVATPRPHPEVEGAETTQVRAGGNVDVACGNSDKIRVRRRGRKNEAARQRRKNSKKELKRMEGTKLDVFLKDMHSPDSQQQKFLKVTRRSRKERKSRLKGLRSEAEEVIMMGLNLGLKANAPLYEVEGKISKLLEGNGLAASGVRMTRSVNDDDVD